MLMRRLGGAALAVVAFVMTVTFGYGWYKVISSDRYSAKDVAISVVIFPYPLWVGAKELIGSTAKVDASVKQQVEPLDDTSRHTNSDASRRKIELWNASMDACQEIIDMSQSKPTTEADFNRNDSIVRKALGLANEFAIATESDENRQVKAFREHYLVGLNAMVSAVTVRDAQKYKQGLHEINAFLDALRTTP